MQNLASQFLTFCRSKPADEAYNEMDSRACALFQFLKAAGEPVREAGFARWIDHDGQEHQTGMEIDDAIDIIAARPTAFGALADRLEAHLAKQSA